MEHIALLVAVLVFWFFVYVRRRVLTSNLNMSLLPLTSPSHAVSRPLLILGHQTKIDIPSHFVLRGETTLLTDAHAHLVEFLGESRRKSRRDVLCGNWLWGGILRAFYDIGSIMAILGQLFGVGVLLWSLFCLAVLFLSTPMPVHGVTKQLVKRGPIPSSLPPLSQNELLLKPLIPGWTLPLSHIPHILASLIVCTAVHELGHAIAAAADGIPLVSWGYSLIFVVPTAFVQLSTVTMKPERNCLRRRLRISAAGSYHNLITLIVLFLFSALKFDKTVWALLGYRSAGAGVVVIDIQEDSPLASHLISGSVITRIDDTLLSGSSNHSAQDLWGKLLLGEVDTGNPEGWCTERDGFDEHSQACCISVSHHHRKHEKGSCFLPLAQSLPVDVIGRCIDPLSLFEGDAGKRCTSDAACNLYATPVSDRPRRYTCIVADRSAMLLRIYFHHARGSDVDEERMVVWRGPRREIWEQVTIGGYLPRARFLPLGLPNKVKLFLEYLRTVSLSLFFFNVLPVRVLDGGEILRVLVDLLLRPRALRQSPFGDGGDDLEIGRSDWSTRSAVCERRARKVEGIVEKATVALVGIVFLGAVFIVGVG